MLNSLRSHLYLQVWQAAHALYHNGLADGDDVRSDLLAQLGGLRRHLLLRGLRLHLQLSDRLHYGLV